MTNLFGATSSISRVIAGFGLMTALGIGLLSTPAIARETCAASFHQALHTIREHRVASISGLPLRLKPTDPTLPGRWLFAGGIAARKASSAAPSAPAIEGDVTDDERRVAGALVEFVETRGTIADFQPTAKWQWLLTKASIELRSYVGQPSHPALCTGVGQMLDFYGTEFSSLKQRHDEIAASVRTSQSAVASRHKAWRTALATPERANTEPLLILPVIKAVADRVLSKTDADTVAVEPDALTALTLTRAALRSESASGLSGSSYRASLALLRALELAVYSERLQERYGPLEAGLFGTAADIRRAHGRSCTCAE
jgi:hypothetical protein